MALEPTNSYLLEWRFNRIRHKTTVNIYRKTIFILINEAVRGQVKSDRLLGSCIEM